MKKLFLISLALVASLNAAYNPRNSNGQATMANSAPVVISSNQSAIPVSNTQLPAALGVSAPSASLPVSLPNSVTVSPTAYNSTTGLINTDMLSGTVSGWYDASNFKSVTLTIYTAASTAGTVSFEQSDDTTNDASGSTWSLQDKTLATQSLTTSQALAASTIYRRIAPITSKYVRLRFSVAISAGSAGVTAVFSQTPYIPITTAVTQATAGSLNLTATVASTTDTKHPTAAAAADATTNPTETQIGANKMQYNGTSWDRERNNWNTTTGDTGAKTTTFNGATQVNYSARGAYIWVNVGTVSGTTPTMAVQLQVSYDTGTTWMNLGPAQANLTTSSTSDLFIIYPANISQAAGTTPVNLTSGATNTVAINSPLPRSWRLVYTIGGTTPSFTITNVQVSYIN